MKASINQKGFSALMVLIIVVGLITVVAIQFNSIRQNQNQTQLTRTNIQSKSEPVKTYIDVKTQTQKLQKFLIAEAALLGVADNLSLYFEDGKNSDKEVSLNSSRSWIPASTIKSYVLLEAFRQKRLGLINFDQKVTIKAGNVVPTELETDEFPRLREGTEVTIRQLVGAMIIQSDNTAYNSLLDILDRRNINDSLKNVGITETVVGEKLNLDGDQFQKDLTVPGRQPNTTTVKDLATYFSLLYSQKIPDSEEILSIFKRQKINNMIPARLPENTIVAHKTGDWAPIYHDGGIVYKADDPFIFIVFTNSGDPAVVAKLAQVAYYQDARYVGKDITLANPPKRNTAFLPRPVYSVSQQEQVLGESTSDKFPDVTADDLGITTKDLRVDSRQINGVKSAWVVPGSILYDLEKALEKGQLILSFDSTNKAKVYLQLANNRLTEIKTLLSQNQIDAASKLLTESISDLKNATDMAIASPDKDRLIIEIKNTHDLYYGVLEQRAHSLPDDKKDEFVDSVYNFYQKERKEISPVINSLVIIDPTKQKPTIGVVEKISPNQLTLKFDDDSKKTINLSSATHVRSVDQEISQNLKEIKVGNKVAVLGPNGSDTIMDAQFILNNIPQGLTDQHKGTVTEVLPNTGMIKVIDQKGQLNLVKVGANTTVKSKDTDVSLEGIKAGSRVVVFGVPESTGSARPSSAPNPPSRVGSPIPKLTPLPTVLPPTSSLTPKPQVEIKATSVTVVGNSSGKNEQQSSSHPPSSGTVKPHPSNKKEPDKKDSKK